MTGQLIFEKQDLTYLSWEIGRNSSGAAGSFMKAYSDISGKKIYYKLSRYEEGNGIVGHECVNELIVDRLLDKLAIDHLHYQLTHADILVNGRTYDTFLCASEDFKQRGESKVALDSFYAIERNEGENPIEFSRRFGWEEYINQMLVVDFLILNRDRHGANIEVLRNSRKKSLRLAPLFDHGLSFLFNCTTEAQIERYDILEDKPTNNFIGSRSTRENLNLISPDRMPTLSPLHESDKGDLMAGLDQIVPASLLDRIWDMIWKRWCYYEDFCHSR